MKKPLRVERVLQLLPGIEAMEPLRALLVSTPRSDEQARWSSSGPYLTIGKHNIDVDALRQRVDTLVRRIGTHLTVLYDAYVRAVDALESGDGNVIVSALADGGAAEERVNRVAQAAAWYEVAFRVASELNDREPEIEMLDRLGRVERERARFDESARYHQRALVLCEATFDHAGAIRACIGLGHASLGREEPDGARAWYLRALRQAESVPHAEWIGTIERHIGEVAWRQGDAGEARARLRRAREVLEPLAKRTELARVLAAIARVESRAGNTDDAIAAGREALAWSAGTDADPLGRVDVLLEMSDVYASVGLLLDAENELRRAEELAITQRYSDRLIDVYIAMGKLCATRGDETGFVFFEQAADLCRALAPLTSREGRVYEEYGNFRIHFKEPEEGLAHLQRARQIFEAAGDRASLARLSRELEALSA